MTRRALSLACVCAAGLAISFVSAQTKTEAPTPFGKVPKAKVRTFVSQVGGFKLEYPGSGDWTVLPGPTGSVLALGEYKKGEALVVIERVTLTEALAPDELAPAADREARIVKEREPGATSLSQQVLDADKRKVIVVQYTRAGMQGPESVVPVRRPAGGAVVPRGLHGCGDPGGQIRAALRAHRRVDRAVSAGEAGQVTSAPQPEPYRNFRTTSSASTIRSPFFSRTASPLGTGLLLTVVPLVLQSIRK